MAATAHLYGPLSDHLVVDVFALFPFQDLFAMAIIAAVDAIGFFFPGHYLLTTPGPPKRLVPFNSCALLAVPLGFFGV